MPSLLIRNARLVNEGRIFDADLLVRHGRIDKIAPSIAASADEEIDAGGQWLLPGMMREMPLLAEFAREGKARVITVALQRPAETLAAPAAVKAALNLPVLALNGPSEPRGLLARFGNPHGGLPHTVLLDAKRQTCAQRTGEVDEDWLRNALNRCTTYQGRP